MKKNKNKQGFTLIELLVVVLIIGILAAIALPQYRKAVAKAELAQIITVTKSIKQAQNRYYLVQEKYSGTLNNLDIEIKDKNVTCTIGDSYGGYVYCYNKNFALWSYYSLNITECTAKTTNLNSPLGYACKDFLKPNTCSIIATGACLGLGISNCLYCKSKQVF